MKIKYLIKKILYRISKLLLRLVFFSCFIISFCFNCFAARSYQFNNFTDFLGPSGEVSCYASSRTSGVLQNTRNYSVAEDGSLDDFVVTDNDSALLESVNSVAINCVGSNICVPFKSRDNFIYRATCVITTVGRLNTFDVNNCHFVINYEYGNYQTGRYDIYGDDFVLNKSTASNTVGGQNYQHLILDLYIDTLMPQVDGDITSIQMEFYNVLNQRLYVSMQPSDNGSVVYFIGDSNDAPSFSGVDTSNTDKTESLENELIDYAESFDPNGFIENQIQNFGSVPNVVNGVSGISTVFTRIYNKIPTFNTVVNILLSLGIFTFVVNIVGMVIKRGKE